MFYFYVARAASPSGGIYLDVGPSDTCACHVGSDTGSGVVRELQQISDALEI